MVTQQDFVHVFKSENVWSSPLTWRQSENISKCRVTYHTFIKSKTSNTTFRMMKRIFVYKVVMFLELRLF